MGIDHKKIIRGGHKDRGNIADNLGTIPCPLTTIFIFTLHQCDILLLLLLLSRSVVSDSVRPHRRQPTRLPHPWDSPGKNTGVGCCFLLQFMKVKSEREVPQLCPTLHDPMDCILPGSSIHAIYQARVLECVPSLSGTCLI